MQRRMQRSLAGHFLKYDAACPPVAGFKPGDIALRIALENDLAHRQCSGEGVPIRVRQRGCEAPVGDDQLSSFDTQVIEGLQLLAEIATCEAGEVYRRFLNDASSGVLP